MWAKYGLGDLLGLKDASGKPYTRNLFASMSKDEAHIIAARMGIPATIGMLGQAAPALSIPSLQKMGTKFLICNNALGLWTLELEARGKGAAAAIDKDLRANVLPGVTIIPAMVQAIEQAQAAGFSYNRQ
jgi:intracellular sulfur oxidation DsrE/DsrF family protein